MTPRPVEIVREPGLMGLRIKGNTIAVAHYHKEERQWVVLDLREGELSCVVCANDSEAAEALLRIVKPRRV